MSRLLAAIALPLVVAVGCMGGDSAAIELARRQQQNVEEQLAG